MDMDKAFATEAAKLHGQPLLDFLLDNAATYWKYEQAREVVKQAEDSSSPEAQAANELCSSIFADFSARYVRVEKKYGSKSRSFRRQNLWKYGSAANSVGMVTFATLWNRRPTSA